MIRRRIYCVWTALVGVDRYVPAARLKRAAQGLCARRLWVWTNAHSPPHAQEKEYDVGAPQVPHHGAHVLTGCHLSILPPGADMEASVPRLLDALWERLRSDGRWDIRREREAARGAAFTLLLGHPQCADVGDTAGRDGLEVFILAYRLSRQTALAEQLEERGQAFFEGRQQRSLLPGEELSPWTQVVVHCYSAITQVPLAPGSATASCVSCSPWRHRRGRGGSSVPTWQWLPYSPEKPRASSTASLMVSSIVLLSE